MSEHQPQSDPDKGAIDLPEEDAAYVASMIAKADGVETPPADAPKEEAPAKTDEPALLAGKFKSAADLETAYKALEAKLGQRAAPTEAPKAVAAPALKGTETPTIEAAKAAVEGADLDFGKLTAEFETTGDITPESRADLAKKGIPKDVVDGFIAGQQAAIALGRQKVFETAGGEDNYKSMIAWAGNNLPPEEIEAFNAVARGSNFAALRMAAAGLYARYEASEGAEPKLVSGGQRPGVDGYQSWAQVRADMSDPRYDRDEAFRASVESKLSRSSL